MVRSKNTNPRRSKRTGTHFYQIGSKHYKVYHTTLKNIRKLQMSTALCIPKAPFARLIRELLQAAAFCPDMRVQAAALEALQEAAELYLVQLFEDSNRCAAHARRITVKPVDMALVLDLRGTMDPGRHS